MADETTALLLAAPTTRAKPRDDALFFQTTKMMLFLDFRIGILLAACLLLVATATTTNILPRSWQQQQPVPPLMETTTARSAAATNIAGTGTATDPTAHYVVSLEQKLEIWDHWKGFLSWQNVWNHTKSKWHSASHDKTNITMEWDPVKFQNHTRLWANQTQAQGKEWWDRAQDYFQNLSQHIFQVQEQQEQMFHPLLEGREKAERDIHALVYLNHSHAYQLLLSRDNKAVEGVASSFPFASHYFLLNQGMEAQINQAYCGVASSVALLNSLRGLVELPHNPIYHPYAYATQYDDAFNECTDAHVIHHNATFDGILNAPFGLNLQAAKAFLECHLNDKEWSVEAHHIDPTIMSLDQMRDLLIRALHDPMASRVMINYHRATVGQIGGGHFSPLGAYSSSQDAFLVLDVAKYKYPPAWISAAQLYRSMATVDVCGIWKGPAAQAQLPPELLHPNSIDDLAAALERLECQTTHRGFVVVKRN